MKLIRQFFADISTIAKAFEMIGVSLWKAEERAAAAANQRQAAPNPFLKTGNYL